MNSQPPDNVDAPATLEVVRVSPKKRKWLTWVSISVMIIGVLVLFIPRMMRIRGTCGQTEVVNNARQIGLALFEFSMEYGQFPDKTTIALVRAKNPTDLPLGTKTSNDFFRQLIVVKIAQSESLFYAKIKGITKPDNIMTTGEALKKGECGFTYLSGLSAVGNPSRPLVVTPLIPGTDRFDPKPFKGKAVILRMDNSVSSMPIREDGYVWINGMNLLDPHHPIWEGKPPVIAYPE